ncbi:MAG: hypothetical protein QW353_08040, partial [Candidatus Korarchaeum sp.]
PGCAPPRNGIKWEPLKAITGEPCRITLLLRAAPGAWMLPIVLEMTSESSWREAVMRFAEELKKVFGDRLLRVIALPSPDDDVYDSNVLVIMSKPSQSDRMEVVRIAVEVGDKLNPLVTDEDERTIRLFLAAGGRDVEVR